MSASSETPDYLGHRQRLRQLFLEGGAEALPDYEILEALLHLAIPRKAVHRPLRRFRRGDANSGANTWRLKQGVLENWRPTAYDERHEQG